MCAKCSKYDIIIYVYDIRQKDRGKVLATCVVIKEWR